MILISIEGVCSCFPLMVMIGMKRVMHWWVHRRTPSWGGVLASQRNLTLSPLERSPGVILMP